MNEHDITLLDPRPHHQRAIARRRGDEQTRRLLEGPALGHGQEGDLGNAELGGESALPGTEDAGADGELGVLDGGRSGDDGAGELGACDPGEGFRCVRIDSE